MGDGARGSATDRSRWTLLLGASFAAMLVAMVWTSAAWADVPDPGPVPEGEDSICSPGQMPGDACITDDGEDGTCEDDDGVPCTAPPDYVIVTCYPCDPDGCSVAAVGATSSEPLGGAAFAMLLAAGLLLRRTRRSRR